MPISIAVKREYEYIGNDLNSDPCIFPRDPRNHVFVQAFNFVTKEISSSTSNYLAFPFIIKLGSSLVGIYSDGDSHASSDKQIMIRSDDNGLTWTSVDFYVVSTGIFNYSLVSDLITPGQNALFKVWLVRNIAGVFSTVTLTPISYGGSDYTLWSRTKPGPGGLLFASGYTTIIGDRKTALFSSADNGVTWTGRSVIFDTAGRQYNECDFVNTTGTNWLAVVREDVGSSNNMYYSTSTNDGVTWSAPTLFTTTAINGRQPCLIKATDGSLILATGDRSGSSGYGGSAGDQIFGTDTTGITVFRSTDNGSTWSYRTRISPMFSTDGGQPMINETTANRVNIVYYARKTTNSNPTIASVTLDIGSL